MLNINDWYVLIWRLLSLLDQENTAFFRLWDSRAKSWNSIQKIAEWEIFRSLVKEMWLGSLLVPRGNIILPLLHIKLGLIKTKIWANMVNVFMILLKNFLEWLLKNYNQEFGMDLKYVDYYMIYSTYLRKGTSTKGQLILLDTWRAETSHR